MSPGRRGHARAVYQAAAREGESHRIMAARRSGGVWRRGPRSHESLRDHGRGRADGGNTLSLRADLWSGSATGAVSLQRRTESPVSFTGDPRGETDLLRADRT